MNTRPADFVAAALALASVGLVLFSALVASANMTDGRGTGRRDEFPEGRRPSTSHFYPAHDH